MSKISPIKDKQVIEKIEEYLREQNFRNYLFVRLGINLGLTLEKLLGLQVEEVIEKNEILINEYKIRIPESLKRDLIYYVGKRQSGLLFRSPTGEALSRFCIYNILRDAARKIGYFKPIGALTLRKTFAYWAYEDQRIPLPLLSKYLGHHTVNHTMRYIDEETDKRRTITLSSPDI